MVLYADDTSILITGPNKRDWDESIFNTHQKINCWFQSNRLTLNLYKTQFLDFRTKHFLKDDVKTMSDQKYISNANEVSFLGLTLDSALSWKKHIDKLTGKLCSACYALRHIKEVVSKDTLKSVYFAHIHSLLRYGIIFRGNSANARKIFIIKKKEY